MKKGDYILLSFVLRGKRRKNVLLALDKPKVPKQIAKECKLSISNISNTLKELLDNSFVKCITPKAHTFKFYELTAKGKRIIKLIDNSQ